VLEMSESGFTVWISRGNGSKDSLIKISLTGLNDKNLWFSIKRWASIEIELVFKLVDVDWNTIRAINGPCITKTSFYCTEQKISIHSLKSFYLRLRVTENILLSFHNH